jgi:hypothetical protein
MREASTIDWQINASGSASMIIRFGKQDQDKSHFLTQKHHNPQASSSSDLEN